MQSVCCVRCWLLLVSHNNKTLASNDACSIKIFLRHSSRKKEVEKGKEKK